MCGIAGLLNHDGSECTPEQIARLDAMVDALSHRGPDDRGVHVEGPVALGVRRLSIIDVEGGHQPISNEDGSVWVAYNGESYNFRELRAELKDAGHRFATGVDTEVVAHGYEEWGVRGLAGRLNGIFAFCVWDARRRVAYLVRDRLGVKPLYYVARSSGLAFSSELRSLACSGLLLPKLDEEAVWSYLLYQYPPTTRTLVAGALRVDAGHMLEWQADTGDVRVEQYWDLPSGGERSDLTLDDAARELSALLDDAVRRQMVSDVPIGCFLSGGLDSSAVAALLARHADEPVRTYSIGYPTANPYDETPHAELIARRIGARHTTITLDEDTMLGRLADYLADIDEPVADAAMLPTYLLAERAARDVKVVLTGEGADEVFGGYEYYGRFVAGPERTSPGRALERNLHARGVRQALAEHLGVAFPHPARDESSVHSGFPYIVQPEFIWCMLNPDRRPSLALFRESLARAENAVLAATDGHTPLQRALYFDTKLWLQQDLMPKLDKATMAHGLEGRVPFLDHRIVEYAFTLPDRFKVRRSEGKLVLRAAMLDVLPLQIIRREKQGFGVPLADWFRGPLRDYVREIITGSSLVEEGLFTAQAMEALIFAHNDLGVDMARMIWAMMNLDCWWRGMRDRITGAFVAASTASLPPGAPTVDILIPVYESFSLVRDCVRSIRAFTQRPFRAIVLDDGSCAATHQRLRDLLADDPRFELVRNEKNLGYVGASIRGMRMCRADYIVLLNSDTAVAPGWLERLVACAESDPSIAIVNPLTNESGNTSIRMAPGLNVLTMAEQIARRSRRTYPDITTAVGMCMLVRRSALELIGGFDPIYQEAYCEESDLSMRFTEAGFRVVAADDAFIYHKGLASYDEEHKDRLYARNRAIFDSRWAVAYDRDWRAYSRSDPLQYVRDALLERAVAEQDAEPRRLALVDGRLGRLSTGRALRAVGDGARSIAAIEVLSRRATNAGRHELERWAEQRVRTPLLTFQGRGVFFPTRSYVDRIPSPASDKLRVTFLMEGFPLCGGVISVVQLARELMLAGHDVRFVTEAREAVPERLNLWAQPLVYRDRRHLIEAFPESDVVVATFWLTAHRYMRALRRRYDFASVYFIQDYEAWFYPESDHLNRENVARSYATTEHHIVKSRWLAELVGQHGPRCEIVPLGLDLGVFYPRGGPRAPHPRVISVAAPRPESSRRGFAETVDAFRIVHEHRPDVELIFYGAEPAQMPSLPFPYTNAGSIYDQGKVAALLSTVDVLLDASHWQGFGRPGLEAMACGVAPVLTSRGGIAEYARDGENCLQITAGDPEMTATSILRLLDDPTLRRRIAADGLATASRFPHEAEARRHIDLYQAWVQQRRREATS